MAEHTELLERHIQSKRNELGQNIKLKPGQKKKEVEQRNRLAQSQQIGTARFVEH